MPLLQSGFVSQTLLNLPRVCPIHQFKIHWLFSLPLKSCVEYRSYPGYRDKFLKTKKKNNDSNKNNQDNNNKNKICNDNVLIVI